MPIPGECPIARDKLHCEHKTGSGSSHGWGGADDTICCLCGTFGKKRWSIQDKHIEGHGPYATERTKVYDE